MKRDKWLRISLVGVVILAALYCMAARPLQWMISAASTQFIDSYAKSQYLKYGANDPVGDKITAEKAFDWRHETWSGDDKPYQQFREEIHAAIASGKPAALLAEEYRKEAQGNQKSALAQFRWAYAIWKLPALTASSNDEHTNDMGAFFTLAYTESPNTYNYARLRYLLSYQYQDGSQTPLGERLLQRDSKDVEVKGHLALDYTGSSPYSLTIKNRAIQLSKELIQTDPRNSSYYAVLAEAYTSSYFRNGHHKQDGLAMIAALKKYLSLAKPNEYFYQGAKERLADMEERVGSNK